MFALENRKNGYALSGNTWICVASTAIIPLRWTAKTSP